MVIASLSPAGSVLNWYEGDACKKANSLEVSTTIYSPWNYAPNGANSSFNYIQGIGAGASKNTYTIVGTYGLLDNGAVGVVYQGAINGTNTSQGSGPGSWTTMVVPKSFNSLGTSIYGVHNKGCGQFDLVGTYVSKTQTTIVGGQALNDTLAFYYTGEITSSPKASNFKSFQARDPITGRLADETYLHSVSGGLAAGNYDFFGEGQAAGDAFVVDLKSGKQSNLRYNNASLSHTVYGIWSNGGSSYTIAGGESTVRGSFKPSFSTSPSVSDATLADYDSITGKVSHVHSYRYPGSGAGPSLETHFEGIWSNGDGLYKLPFWSFDTNLQPAGAGLAIVQRLKNGEFSDANWITFPNPAGVTVYTNDSVWDGASVGGQISSSNPGVFNTYAALSRIS
jgi:hypothetical protein